MQKFKFNRARTLEHCVHSRNSKARQCTGKPRNKIWAGNIYYDQCPQASYGIYRVFQTMCFLKYLVFCLPPLLVPMLSMLSFNTNTRTPSMWNQNIRRPYNGTRVRHKHKANPHKHTHAQRKQTDACALLGLTRV